MKKFIVLACTITLTLAAFAGGNLVPLVNPKNIRIIRDQWGVPHIYANTDEEVAYGLAWATAEDDFSSMQENFYTARGRLAEVKGKDGAIMDFLAGVLGVRQTVEKYYKPGVFSAKFERVLGAYVQGVNDYARKHPDQLHLKDALPVTKEDILCGYVMGLALMTNVQFSILKITEGSIGKTSLASPKGSNGFAVNGSKTTDGYPYLGINSHQPLAGPYSWYEAHLHSNEGWNILGGTFPGGVTIFHGANENLGWAHTVSFADYDDVYKLKMHPTDKLKYWFNGSWLTLIKKEVKLKVKLFWFIKIPVKKKFFQSVYGPVLESKGEYYALRFPAAFDIRCCEAWYEMNKSKNLDEFKAVLAKQELPGLNIVYADKFNNIFYTDNGHFPKRDPHYNWWKVLPGDTSATLWRAGDYYPFSDMVQVTNPACGYLFNNNNTPFHCSAPADNPNPKNYILAPYYFPYENNRSLRTAYLFANSGKLSYDDFKKLKFDQQFMHPAYNYAMENIETVMNLDPRKYPQIRESIEALRQWNHRCDVNNKEAALITLVVHDVINQLVKEGNFPATRARIKESFIVKCVENAQKHLKDHFGTVRVPLGDLQKLVRGDKALPIGGIPDVIAAMMCKPWKNGMLQADVGESYIELVRFTPNGPVIESVSPYGSSNVPGDKHYDDQMELFVNHKLKKMSMDYQEILKNKERLYRPG